MKRELAIIEKKTNMFETIKDHVSEYHHNKIELFFTYRRIFEQYLIKGALNKAEPLIPLLDKTLNEIESVLFIVYKISYYKNLFHFYNMKGDKLKAEYYFKTVFNDTKRYNLYGQNRSLLNIKENLSN